MTHEEITNKTKGLCVLAQSFLGDPWVCSHEFLHGAHGTEIKIFIHKSNETKEIDGTVIYYPVKNGQDVTAMAAFVMEKVHDIMLKAQKK
jgi:hypothetical protein